MFDKNLLTLIEYGYKAAGFASEGKRIPNNVTIFYEHQ